MHEEASHQRWERRIRSEAPFLIGAAKKRPLDAMKSPIAARVARQIHTIIASGQAGYESLHQLE